MIMRKRLSGEGAMGKGQLSGGGGVKGERREKGGGSNWGSV